MLFAGIKFMKRQYLILIICVALFVTSVSLRVWRLDKAPAAMTGDELSIAYNAFSLGKTGTDEYGKFLPLSFKSFGDYKVPLPMYLHIPSVLWLGINPWSVRLPTAIISSLTPVLVFLLVWELGMRMPEFRKSEKRIVWAAAIAGAFLALSPWHIHFSRGAWEASIAVTFTVAGMYYLLRDKAGVTSTVLGMLLLGLSMYTYHASRVYTIVLIGMWLVSTTGLKIWQEGWSQVKNIRQIVIGLMVFGIVASPAVLALTNVTGNARFTSSSVFSYWSSPIFSQELGSAGMEYTLNSFERMFAFANSVAAKWLAYVSPAHLFALGDPVERHSVPEMGRLYAIDAVWILLIVIYVLMVKKNSWHWFLLGWIVAGMLPAAVTRDEYHTIRSLMMIVPMTMLGGLAVVFAVEKIPSSLVKKAVVFIAGGTYIFVCLFYVATYQFMFSAERAESYQYGIKDAMEFIEPLYGEYDHVVIDTPPAYGNPYIHVVSYLEYDPKRFQEQVKRNEFTLHGREIVEVTGLENFEFRSIYWPDDRSKRHTLFVGTPLSLPMSDLQQTANAVVLKEIFLPTGVPIFRIVAIQ